MQAEFELAIIVTTYDTDDCKDLKENHRRVKLFMLVKTHVLNTEHIQ